MSEKKLNEQGKENYGKFQIIAENILTILNVAVAVWAMWSIMLGGVPIVSLLYLIFVIFMMVFFLRKHLCTHCCYYGKACHCGWGVMALMYKKESGDKKKAKTWAGPAWMILMILPIIVTAILVIIEFSWLGIIQIGALVLILILQLFVHIKDCRSCKMNKDCPGVLPGTVK